MPISTAKTYLMYESTPGSGTFTKLIDIVNYPDLGSAPNKIDTTDLSATNMKTFINGLMEAPDLTFEAMYDKTLYSTLKSAESASRKFQVHFGTAGADGKFEWSGKLKAWVTGAGVDEVRKMTIQVSAESEITTVA